MTIFKLAKHDHRHRLISATLLLTLVGTLLSGCGGPNTTPRSRATPTLIPTPQLASKALAEGDITQAAHIYAQLANTEADPTRKQEYQLLATEHYFDSELYNDGNRMFAVIPATLANASLQQRRDTLVAYSALAAKDPQQALELLPQTRAITNRIQRIRTLEIAARAHYLLGDFANTLKTRILLEANLKIAQSIYLNRSKIRAMLAELDKPALQRMATTPGGSLYRGWLEYALLQRSQGTVSPEVYAQRNKNWRGRYPGHPAELPAELPESENLALATTPPTSIITTDQVALLLPLSGQFSELGEAIKTGFVAARFEDGGSTQVRVYDTQSDFSETLKQYQLATAEGASIIIGPLNKSAVINLAAGNRVSVPTLSLNYVGDEMPGHSNLYQFGLLPEDEARDAAHYALSKNFRKALVITTDNTLGTRLSTAFNKAFSDGGGQILGSEVVPEDSYDYSPQLIKILAINSSNSRKRRLEKLLETKLEFEPSIRGDIDVIFMAVGSEIARLLRPQLQFHHAGKIPLLSTSLVFSGETDKKADSDLSGIVYNDIPWILTDAASNTHLHKVVSGSQQDYSPGISRLHALGIDAYRLHTQLENMRLDPLYSINGKTGALSLAEGNQVRRRLQWAEFQEGVPAKIADELSVTQSLSQIQSDL